LTDLLAERIQMLLGPVVLIQNQIAAGRVRALAVTSERRFDEMGDVPTLKESGFGEFPAGTWSGVLAPLNTPSSNVARLNAAINQVLTTNEFRSRLRQAGALPSLGSAEEFSRSIQQQAELWSQLIRICPECTDVNCTLPKKPCSYDSSLCCDPK
jgi:tripartite-type tricarboxylate transporter receptor subunit TctC